MSGRLSPDDKLVASFTVWIVGFRQPRVNGTENMGYTERDVRGTRDENH